ncbi:HelD family protein [Streptomyces sp. NPDC088400]|uniref:HelD family protein n=1 Tax=Streptomyces sp. NPDC088400 TaxID=3365861 RepID=UPI00382E9460
MTAPDPDLADEPNSDRDHVLGHALDGELDSERAYHQTCRAALAGMVDGAHEQVVTGQNAFASGADAEVLGRHLRSYAKELRLEPDGPLFFGRLDFAATADGADGNHGPGDSTGDHAGDHAGDQCADRDHTSDHAGDQGADRDYTSDHAGQSYHIGRRRISEHPSAPPLVVDWRAPVSRAFYRASARDPQGVAVRRRFGWAPWSKGAPEDLTSLEDEPLGAGGAPPTAGSAILTGEIERPRVGPMRDIAATIQPEQDALVRSPLSTSVCVQGAPGTGKTAVGLHRAAYLLYTYPQRIRRGGLLILGPNRTFLSYISEVLPALGEIGIRQSTVADEIARPHVRTTTDADTGAAAVVKHDARMAEVLHRALYGRVAAPAEPLTVPDGSYRWRLGLDELARIVDEVRAEAPPYATGRERIRSRAVRAVQLQAERRAGPQSAAWAQRVGRSRAVTAYLDTTWPKVRPEEVLAALLADPGPASDGILTLREQHAIRRPRPRRGDATGPLSARAIRSLPWSAADLVLLDELAGLIEHPEGYGHIVIDEAQDLSPMESRAIARRAAFGSLTVLGDLAQGTTPWAARSWPQLLAHLGRPDAAVIPLTTGFRVPGAVVDLANRLLASLDVDVPPARSLCGDGHLTIRQVSDLTSGVTEAVREALTHEGSIGVIADGGEADRLRTALDAAGIATSTADELGTTAARVTVLPATAAKGLEYDHVVLAEPAAIAEAEARGPHRLYVALTRAVSRLDIVHGRPLPEELA